MEDQGSKREGILYPNQNDVKFGRGGDTNYHIGNSRFRHFVSQYKLRYQHATSKERKVVVQEIVTAWRNQDPPGRFLARSNPNNSEQQLWHDVGDKQATKKTIKILGEGLGSKRRKDKDKDKDKHNQKDGSPEVSTRKASPTPQAGPAPASFATAEINEQTVALAPIATAGQHPVGAPAQSGAELAMVSQSMTPIFPAAAAAGGGGGGGCGGGLPGQPIVPERDQLVQISRGSSLLFEHETSSDDASSVVSLQSITGCSEYPPIAASLTDVFHGNSGSSSENNNTE